MSQLPSYVRKLPFLFYALALILGGWRFLNEWIVIETTYGAVVSDFSDDSFNQAHSVGRSAAIYWGLADLIYLSASAAMLQVLIAIYDKMKGPSE